MAFFLASAWATGLASSICPLFLFIPLWLLTMAWLATWLVYLCVRDTIIWFVALYRWLTHKEVKVEPEIIGKDAYRLERERMKWV